MKRLGTSPLTEPLDLGRHDDAFPDSDTAAEAIASYVLGRWRA